MESGDLSETMVSLYSFCKNHYEDLRDAGFSPTETFWVNFACLPFLPWSKSSEKKLHLSRILRLYLGLYRHYIAPRMKAESEPDFLDLLRDRYYMIKEMVSGADLSQQDADSQLSSLILPRSCGSEMQTYAALVVLNSKLEWERQKSHDPLPCMLVEDI
jgi:hypothetical protein